MSRRDSVAAGESRHWHSNGRIAFRRNASRDLRQQLNISTHTMGARSLGGQDPDTGGDQGCVERTGRRPRGAPSAGHGRRACCVGRRLSAIVSRGGSDAASDIAARRGGGWIWDRKWRARILPDKSRYRAGSIPLLASSSNARLQSKEYDRRRTRTPAQHGGSGARGPVRGGSQVAVGIAAENIGAQDRDQGRAGGLRSQAFASAARGEGR